MIINKSLNNIFKLGSIICFSVFFFLKQTSAQTDPRDITRILFVFDASNSMHGQWENTPKIVSAKRLLIETVDRLKEVPNVQVALRVYGHQSFVTEGNQDCNDTKLEVPFRWLNQEEIKQKVKGLIPRGTTPIALSLEKSAEDFPDTLARNVIILITDGVEACDMDPCAVSKALRSKGIDVKPFVVGLGIDESYMDQLTCVGNYFDAKDPESFENIMEQVVSQAISNTTYQINLNNGTGQPKNTNVPITLNQEKTEVLADYYIHTLNVHGLPDTLGIDPLFKYTVVVHTIPPVVKRNVQIVPGNHNVIQVDAPMGSLDLKFPVKNLDGVLNCIVRHKDYEKTIHVQEFNSKERYLVGDYQLEVLTLPRMYFNVSIKENETYNIVVPPPGNVTFSKRTDGIGSIFLKEGVNLTWVSNSNPNVKNEQFVLQPGEYIYIFRSKFAKETIYTIKKEFTVTSNSSQNISI